MKPNAQALFDAGLAAEDDGQLSDAEAFYRRALMVDPHHADALINLGRLVQDHHMTLARDLWKRAHVLRHPLASFNLAVTYHERGQLGIAAQWYRKALRLDPNHADARSNYTILTKQQQKRGQ